LSLEAAVILFINLNWLIQWGTENLPSSLQIKTIISIKVTNILMNLKSTCKMKKPRWIQNPNMKQHPKGHAQSIQNLAEPSIVRKDN